MWSLALDPELVEEVEQWLAAQEMPPTKTLFVETAIREQLRRLKNKAAPDDPPTQHRKRGKVK